MFRAYHTKYGIANPTPKLFFDDTLDSLKTYTLIDPTLKTEVGKAGSFSFKIPIENEEFDNFEDLVSYIDLYRENELIFSGRVFGVGPKDFYGKTTVYAEGLLAVFNDSIFEPIIFNGTLTDLLQVFLDQHNAQVDDYKQVQLGVVTVEDDYVYRAYENYEPTINRLDDLVDSYGGYMSVRKENGQLYLDYLIDFEEESVQTIDFGENLLDLTQATDVSELATVLIPFGANVENEEDGSTSRVDITSVNLGVNYIENIEGINRYGRIWATNTWDDVTVPTILKTKAEKYLAEMSQPKVSIDVTAVDMAKAGSNINFFKAGQYVHVKSAFHGIDRNILIKSQDLKLNDPAANTMTMSDTFTGFIGKTNKNVVTINKNIDYIFSRTDNNSQKADELEKQIKVINEAGYLNAEGVAGIYSSVITELENRITSQTAVLQTQAGQIEALILENNNLKKYLRFDENGLEIGSSDSTISSIQDEQSYKYVDASGSVLFEIGTSGVDADTYNARKQISFSTETMEGQETAILQWAIRHGEVDNDGNFNLNDVWIGG